MSVMLRRRRRRGAPETRRFFRLVSIDLESVAIFFSTSHTGLTLVNPVWAVGRNSGHRIPPNHAAQAFSALSKTRLGGREAQFKKSMLSGAQRQTRTNITDASIMDTKPPPCRKRPKPTPNANQRWGRAKPPPNITSKTTPNANRR